MRTIRAMAAIVAFGLAVGCSNDPAPCTVGRTAECACTDGSTGAQVCGDDHTFAPCVCDGDPADGGPRDAPVLPPGDGQKPASDAGKPKLDLPKPTLTWRKMVSPKKSNFYDVLPLSKTDVFVAGESGTLLHYNGNSKQQLTQVMSGTKWSLRALTPYGTGKVLAVGL